MGNSLGRFPDESFPFATFQRKKEAYSEEVTKCDDITKNLKKPSIIPQYQAEDDSL